MNVFTPITSIVFFACRFCLLTGFWFCIQSVQAQSPGGVSTPAFWIKADAGFTGATWADQSGNGIDLTHISGTLDMTILQNYNPMVRYVTFGNMSNSTTQVGTGNTVSAFFVGQSTDMTAAFVLCIPPFNVTTYSQGPVRFNRRTFTSYGTAAIFYPTGFNDVFPARIKSIVSTRNTSGNVYDNAIPNSFTPLNVNNGSYPYIEGPAGSLMGEGIIFNRILTANEIQHVHSYLAIKYGATLAENYLQSNDTIVYQPLTAPSYPNDIIGIAQDASAGLLQKQSHTANDSLKIYIQDSLFVSNALNTNTFPAGGGSPNKYVMIGHNGAAQNGKAFSTEYPAAYVDPVSGTGIYNRISREWKVTNTRYNGPYSLQIQLDAAAAPINAADLRLMIDSDDGNFTNATVVSPVAANAPTITVSGTLITIENIRTTLITANTTSYLTLASIGPATPLPISLLHFEAVTQPATGQINLHWTTTQEKDNSHFIVERSRNAVNFEPLDTVAGKGTLTVLSSYAITDASPWPGTTYYRLKQVDLDGTYHYSSIQSATLSATDLTTSQRIIIYPNPVTNQLYFSFTQHRPKNIQVEIYNAAGQRIKQFILPDTQVFIDMADYPVGLYYLKIGLIATTKVIKK